MTVQLSVAVRNARLDQIEVAIGTGPTLRIYTATQPADCTIADTATKLVEDILPSDWLAAASGGTKALSGTWSSVALATGTAGYFRIYTGGTCHMQGSVGPSGDIVLSTSLLAIGQTVTITAFNMTDANA